MRPVAVVAGLKVTVSLETWSVTSADSDCFQAIVCAMADHNSQDQKLIKAIVLTGYGDCDQIQVVLVCGLWIMLVVEIYEGNERGMPFLEGSRRPVPSDSW